MSIQTDEMIFAFFRFPFSRAMFDFDGHLKVFQCGMMSF